MKTSWFGKNRLIISVLRLTLCLGMPGIGLAEINDDQLVDAIAHYNAQQLLGLPRPDEKMLALLHAGGVVSIRERIPIESADGDIQDRHRFVGYRLIDRPRLLVWLAALNNDARHLKRATEYHHSSDGQGGAVWYQHIELPWPVRDRHWMIESRKDIQLAEKTNGLAWEHAWALREDGQLLAENLLKRDAIPGLDERDGRRAIYLPVNRGAWTMFSLDEQHTLVAAHLSTVLAGWIPDSWVAAFVSRQYTTILDSLPAKSDQIATAYRDAQPVDSGVGVPVSREMARRANDLSDVKD